MNRRRPSSPRSVRTFGVASAKSVQRAQRPRRRAGVVSSREAAMSRGRAALHDWIDRWAERASERHSGGPGTSLIGRDVARPPSRLRTRSWAPVVAAAVAGALFLAVLRMDVIRMRFSVAQAFNEEVQLEDVKRELTVEMRQLRDPAVLARRAEKLGFRRAERLIDLDGGIAPTEPRESRPQGTEAITLASATRSQGRRP